MKQISLLALIMITSACTVKVAAPDKPITINLNVKIEHEVRIKVEKATFEDIPVTCSFGVTSIKFKARTPSELIEQADLALYEAKSLGRNQVALWDASLEEFKLFRSE